MIRLASAASETTREPTDPSRVPLVRYVVVNYNAPLLTRRCLESIAAVDWPSDRYEVVVIDNGSSDRVALESVADRFDRVRLIGLDSNVGFGAACNLGMADIANVDYVALVNNDAFVDRTWLRPLVDALEHAPHVGAASPKILFEPRFMGVELRTTTFVPGGRDRRDLGVQISGIEVAGLDEWDASQLIEGFWGLEFGAEGEFQWSHARAVARVPVRGFADAPTECRVRLAAEREKEVVAVSGGEATTFVVRPQPDWYVVALSGKPYDVVNNAGSLVTQHGFGADRGFLERDEGQFDKPTEVFAWCGAAVLLRPRYLRHVGGFDPRFFLYYEDTDLSWRGRHLGWHYLYVPRSVVRHVHSATTRQGFERAAYFADRNRLLMLARNATPRSVAGAVGAYCAETWKLWWRDVVVPRRLGVPAQPELPLRRIRALAGFGKNLVPVLADRWRRRPR